MSGKENKSKLNQSSKSTSSKKRRNISLPHSEFPAATSTFSGLVVAFLLGLFGVTNTYASSISISLTGNVNLNLVKSNTEAVFGKSTTQTATVTSDHFTGYTLTIAGSNDTGRLVGANDSTKYLSSIATPLTESQFDTDDHNDQWGFLPSKLNSITNNVYQPSPTTAETTIDVTDTPNTSGTDYTLALGARVSSNMALDSYGQTFVLAATGNGYDYHIGFTDDLETMPADMYGNTQSNTVTLPSTTPTKAGYTFKGWCSVATTNSGTVCLGTTYQRNATITLDSTTGNDMNLHAIWEAITFDKAFANASKTKSGNYYKMQDMTTSICNAVAIGQEGTLVDTRSGSKTYKVGKLKDGRCWMLDNLALGGSSTIALKTTDTNITADWTLPASTTTGFDTYSTARINIAYNNTIPSDTMSQAGQWKIGTYYNYCAVSAGTYCPASSTAGSTPAKQDICPKGWRMPSGGSGGEYYNLYSVYSNYTNFRSAVHLPLSGHYDNYVNIDQGSVGRWWTNTFYNSNNMYHPAVTKSSVSLDVASLRYYGFTLRCIAK